MLNVSEPPSPTTVVTCAFKTSLVDSTTVTIAPGTINALVPSNMFDVNGRPYLTISATDTTQYVLLTASTNGKIITSASLSASTSNVDPSLNIMKGAAPASFQVLIAIIVNVLGQQIFQIGLGNITAIPKQMFLEGKVPVGIGAEPFDRWWSWVYSQLC